jgi:hypothetical protein
MKYLCHKSAREVIPQKGCAKVGPDGYGGQVVS